MLEAVALSPGRYTVYAGNLSMDTSIGQTFKGCLLLSDTGLHIHRYIHIVWPCLDRSTVLKVFAPGALLSSHLGVFLINSMAGFKGMGCTSNGNS